MNARNHTNILINTIGLSLIVLAVLFNRLPVADIHLSHLFKILRILCNVLFFALWILSLNWRVVQRPLRNCLIATASMELLWILIRTVKYEVLESLGTTAARYGWYLFYLPSLMIPALCLILSLSVGKPENYRLPKRLLLLPAASFLLFLLVLTNDLHQTVFIIPYEMGWASLTVGNYSYGIGYFLIYAYAGICALSSFILFFIKYRVSGSRFWQFFPLMLLAVGGVIYLLYAMHFYRRMDISAFFCFIITSTLESCIQTNLIPTNSGYNALFQISSIRAIIVDNQYQPLICSNTYEDIPVTDMKNAEHAPVLQKDGLRLSSAPVKGGHVLWQDDLSELNAVLAKLSETNDFLQGKNQLIKETYEYQKREQQLIEKNRLYNRILTQTKSEIEKYSDLIEQLEEENDPQKTRQLAVKIAFVSAFIKRHDNLIFLGEATRAIAPAELFYCIEESLSNLLLGGTECYCSSDLKMPLEFNTISQLYESFYKIIYHLIDRLSSICVYLIEEHEQALVVMRICCKENEDLSYIHGSNLQVTQENEEWIIRICG